MGEWDDLKGESYPVSIKLSLPNKDKLPTKENTKFADDCILKRIEGSRRRMKSYDSSWLEISVPNPEKMKEVLQMMVRNGQAMEVTPAWKANFPTWWHQNQCFIRRRLPEGVEDSSMVKIGGFSVSTTAAKVGGAALSVSSIPTILGATGTFISLPTVLPLVVGVVGVGSMYVLSKAAWEFYKTHLEAQDKIGIRRASQADAERAAKQHEADKKRGTARHDSNQKLFMKCMDKHDAEKCMPILST